MATTQLKLILSRNCRRLVCLALMFLCLGLASCAMAPSPRESGRQREIQWPPLPLTARIVWVKEIRDYQDAGISKGFWQQVADFFTGEEENRIGKPYGVYFDDRNRLFIVDVAHAMVHAMDLKENNYALIGAGSEQLFRSPVGITGDDEDNLYITDSGGGSIYRYNLRKSRLEPFIIADLGRPTGIAFNRNNRLLYITDTTSHQIAVFDLRGNFRLRIGSRGRVRGSSTTRPICLWMVGGVSLLPMP